MKTIFDHPCESFFGFLLAGCASSSPAQGAPPVEQPHATEQQSLIAARTGIWDVTETVWASPSAAPVTTTGLVAERRMIASLKKAFPKVKITADRQEDPTNAEEEYGGRYVSVGE